MKKAVANIIARAAKNEAIKNANSACAYFFYQPKVPKDLKKLRKYTLGTPVVLSLKVRASGTPSETPDKHTGKRLSKIINKDGFTKYAAFGETLWYYKYHYTTAQMELSNGTVKTTSGRQWGENATKATSPYYLPDAFENTEARTYWGS